MATDSPAGPSVALVTGAARGIGAACAESLSRQGHHVVVADRDGAGAAAVAGRLSDGGAGCSSVTADVTDADQVSSLVRDAAAIGPLRVLVNNVGIGLKARVHELTVAEWDSVVTTTLTSAFLVSREVLGHMVASEGDRTVVNVASVQGLRVVPRGAAYGAAKAGLIALTRSIALDYGADGIRCNAVCPGTILTMSESDLARGLARRPGRSPEATSIEQLEEQHPLGRLGTAQEVANAVAWLASPAASFVSGAVLTVDGGLSTQTLG